MAKRTQKSKKRKPVIKNWEAAAEMMEQYAWIIAARQRERYPERYSPPSHAELPSPYDWHVGNVEMPTGDREI
jgi:hypothetical protein